MASDLHVLLVDNNPLWREGLCVTLQKQFPWSNVQHCETGTQALHYLHCASQEQNDVDVLMLEVQLPDMHAFDLLRQLHGRGPLPLALIFASSRTAALATSAQQAGAHALVSPRITPTELGRTMTRLLAGEYLFDFDAPSNPRHCLTQRETQILMSLTEGLSNKEICERLVMAEPTIKTHLRSLFEKLDVKNRTACVSAARKVGLV